MSGVQLQLMAAKFVRKIGLFCCRFGHRSQNVFGPRGP